MRKKLYSLVIVSILAVSICVPTSALGDDAGLPTILSPEISVSVSVNKTDINPGEKVALDFYIKNESKKTLYINRIDFLIYSIYKEKDGGSIDFEGMPVSPGKIVKISGEYETEPHLYSLYNGSVKCTLYPRIEYCYYTEKVKNDEIPRWNGLFEYNSINSITLTAIPPYDFSSNLEIDYRVKKVSEDYLYEFNLTLKNKTDETISDFYIISSLHKLEAKDGEIPNSIKPNETLNFTMTYDYYDDIYREFGETKVALYVLRHYEDDCDISDTIETLNFPKEELQLEAEILCDVKQAYYGEEIPYTIVLHNPTNKTYENIKNHGQEYITKILPGKTIYIEDTTKERIRGYGLSIFEGFDFKTFIKPYISLEYNNCNYQYYEWCINYDEIVFPEVEILMPPQFENLIDKIEISTEDSSEYKIYYNNTSEEEIEIEIIGCPENGGLIEYASTILFKGDNKYFTFDPGKYSYTEDENGNKYLELLIIGYGEDTNKLYWLNDSFPIKYIESTPTSTKKPTQTPSPAPKGEVIAIIKNNDRISNDGTTQNINLEITNNTPTSLLDVEVIDSNDNLILKFPIINKDETFSRDIDVDYTEEIFLKIKYKQYNETNEIITGKIINLTPENKESDNPTIVPEESLAGEDNTPLLPILAFVAFIILSATTIIIIRKRKTKSRDVFQ